MTIIGHKCTELRFRQNKRGRLVIADVRTTDVSHSNEIRPMRPVGSLFSMPNIVMSKQDSPLTAENY